MGSLFCCLRGSGDDHQEDGDSVDNEQIQATNRSNTTQAGAGFTLFLTKRCNGLFGREVTGTLQSSSSTRDGKGLNHSHVEPKLVLGSSGLTFTCDEDCASSKDDECLICLEGQYTSENPRITTRCSHHSHLSCILEWQQRSEFCPVCSKLMEFEEMS